jgi:hypothetical protein
MGATYSTNNQELQKSLFNIPYWHIKTKDFAKKKEQIKKLLVEYPENKVNLQEFYTNRQGERQNLLQAFCPIVQEEIEQLTNDIEMDLAVTNVWSVSYQKGDYHSPHNHSGIGLSAIMYLDLPEGTPGTLFLQPWNDWLTDTSQYGEVFVEEGDIVIVPSFVVHYTKPNITDDVKRIIAWDMKPINPGLTTNPN